MIRLTIEVDDHFSWAEATKEAVAERLGPLGRVRVLKVETDKPQQLNLPGYQEPKTPSPSPARCPRCGVLTVRMQVNGQAIVCDPQPKAYWVDLSGSGRVVTFGGELVRCSFSGSPERKSGMGWVPHDQTCKGG